MSYGSGLHSFKLASSFHLNLSGTLSTKELDSDEKSKKLHKLLSTSLQISKGKRKELRKQLKPKIQNSFERKNYL